MANEASFHARITADVSQFNSEVQAAAQAIQQLIKATQTASKSSATGKGSGASSNVKNVFDEAKRASQAIHQQNMAQIDAEGKARQQSNKISHLGTSNRPGSSAVNDILNEVSAQNKLNATVANNGKVELEAERLRQRSMDARLKDHQTISSLYDQTIAQEQKSRSVASANIKAQMQEQAKANSVHAQALRDNARFDANAQRRQMDAMVTGRYALYDLATSYDLVGMKALALAKAMASTIGVAAQFETAFTSVERVLQPTTAQAEKLKKSLIDLSTAIPVAFTDITQIATLGAQMGIQASGIEQFTKTIASFSAVTGSTIDATAQSFGRLASLTKTSKEQFNNLGSSILYAGNNAVATEQEVMKMSESIAGATTQAGYAADQTVGLATALSSLAIAPEAARGVITRVFTDINRAVSKGGSELKAFAGISGMTTTQMKEMWKQDPNKFFMSLLSGLSSTKDFTGALDAMGLSGTREIVTLTRLSQNLGLVKKSMSDASTSFKDGTALSKAYAKTSDNLQAKIQMLKNSIAAMADSMGSGMLAPMGELIDMLNGLGKAMAEFNKNPIGQSATFITGTLTVLTAGMMLFKGASLRATAQLFALRTAMIQADRVGSLNGGFRELFSTMTGGTRVIKDNSGALQFMTKAQAAAAGQQMQWSYGNLAIARSVKLTTGEIKMMTHAEAEAAGAGDLWAASAKRASIATRTFGIAMKGAGWLGVALMVADAVGMIVSSMDSLQSKTKSFSGDFLGAGGGATSMGQAIAEDTKAFKNGEGALATWETRTKNSSTQANGLATAIDTVTGGQAKLVDGLTKTTTEVTRQTIAIGKNTQQWLANAIANDPKFQKWFKDLQTAFGDSNLIDMMNRAKISLVDLQNAALANPGSGAMGWLENWVKKSPNKALASMFNDTIKSAKGSRKALAEQANAMQASGNPLVNFVGGLINMALALDKTTAAGAATTNMLKLLGVDLNVVTPDVTTFSGAVKTALEVLQDLTSKTFLSLNGITGLSSAMTTLGSGLKDSKSWDKFGSAGVTNINNLLGAIDAIVTKSNGSKQKAANDLVALKKALISMGLGSKTALAIIQKELDAIGGSAKRNAKATKSAVADMAKAIKAGIEDATSKDVIKTLSDYVSQIKSTLSNAFDIRYGKSTAYDALSKSWLDIADAATQAKIAVAAAQAEIDQTKADKSVLEYQLSVATRYGDEKRAAELKAQIAKMDAQLADQQLKLADAQDSANKTLVGNSKAAIANRATVRGLVSNYNDYLTSLANTNMSSVELSAQAKSLADEFLAQGTNIGFAKDELIPYIDAFASDFTTVINNIPKDVTVRVDTDPAARAVRDFVASTNDSLAAINDKVITVNTVHTDTWVGAGGSTSGTGTTGSTGSTGGTGATGGGTIGSVDPNSLLGKGIASSIGGGLSQTYWQTMISHLSDPNYVAPTATSAEAMRYLKSWSAQGYYAAGGFIPKGTDTVPAMLTPGEFVLNRKASQYYGPDYLNAMNNMRLSRPMPSGQQGMDGGSGIVQLSPQDRALLRSALERPVELYAGNTQIANSVSTGNNILAKRGRN